MDVVATPAAASFGELILLEEELARLPSSPVDLLKGPSGCCSEEGGVSTTRLWTAILGDKSSLYSRESFAHPFPRGAARLEVARRAGSLLRESVFSSISEDRMDHSYSGVLPDLS